jgi:predicted DsbA family dithiol-disulfide isomerase
MHENLIAALKGHEHRVRLVRKQVPLRMHPHAPDAALAAACADKMGQGDRMADGLFRAPVGSLTPQGTTKMAVAMGLDEPAFVKCLNDPATGAVQVRDRALYDAVGGDGLPLLWVGYTRLEGLTPEAEVRRVLDAELAR